MRIALEIIMFLALAGGLMYVMKVMAKESREDKAQAIAAAEKVNSVAAVVEPAPEQSAEE